MTCFKGNCGNLMQHWVLCEVLEIVRRHETQLTFIDAHSMAPLATHRTEKIETSGRKFDNTRKNLPGQGSPFENAWHRLAPSPNKYPNSANFVSLIWDNPRKYSMVLCEKEAHSAELLKLWAAKNDQLSIEVATGDWRCRFEHPFVSREGIVFISFDPYMFNSRNRRKRKLGNMYPDDLCRIVEATRNCRGKTLVQLSTYDTNDGNSQDEVAEVIRLGLVPGGFNQAAIVRPNNKMMSLLYQRDVGFASEFCELPVRFKKWYSAI